MSRVSKQVDGVDFTLRLGHTIKRAEQALIGEKSKALRDLDLTVPQYAVLMAVSQSPGMSGAQLARACMVTPQSMNTVLVNLENKALIDRSTTELHLKMLIVALTPAGRTLVEVADQRARSVEARLTASLSGQEQDQLRDLLERCITALQGPG